MLDNLLPWLAIGAIALVVAAYVRFGKTAALGAGAALALLLAYLKGRGAAGEDAKKREDKNDQVRVDTERSAVEAADRRRDDLRADPGKLREPDEFERR